MSQQDLLDYLLLAEHNCYIYEQRDKDDGTHVSVRNNTTRKIKVVYPVKKGTYSPAAVAQVCIVLDVPVHPYAQHMIAAVTNMFDISPEIAAKMEEQLRKSDEEGNSTEE